MSNSVGWLEFISLIAILLSSAKFNAETKNPTNVGLDVVERVKLF
jgi:hypothetical protein